MIDPTGEADVMIGFCHNGSVATCFMNSLLGAFSEDMRRDQRRLIEYHDAAGPYIHDNRARIVRYFLQYTDYQWLWMLDNDMQFDANALYQLLSAAEENDLYIVGGAYWNQYTATGRYLSWLMFTPDGIRALPDLPGGTDPVEVTAVGMGCTLLHRDVLEAVAKAHEGDPWDTFSADMLMHFEDGKFLVGRVPEDFDEKYVNGRRIKSVERCGEDVTLCLRAQAQGFSSYGLPSLVLGHYKPHFMEEGPKVAPGSDGQRRMTGAKH